MKIQKYKNDFDYSYTLGITLTIELLKKHPKDVLYIYFHSTYSNSDNSKVLIDLINKYNIPNSVNDKIFNIVSQKENDYVIGVFKKYETSLQEGNHICLVNPSNSGNLGTILRSAIGFGIKNIAIIKPAVDIFDPKTVRASMGALFHVNFEYFNSFEEYYKKYSKNNIYTFMLKAKNSLANTNFKKPYTLTFGNEATGLPDEFLQYNSVIINQSKDIDSFNLTIALSIACYEATKNDFNN